MLRRCTNTKTRIASSASPCNMRLLQSISFSTANLIDPLSEQPATEHARKHLSLSRLDSLESELELLCNFETTATEHACRLITAVSLHCKLSLALLLQSMAVSFYPHSYTNLELRKKITTFQTDGSCPFNSPYIQSRVRPTTTLSDERTEPMSDYATVAPILIMLARFGLI